TPRTPPRRGNAAGAALPAQEQPGSVRHGARRLVERVGGRRRAVNRGADRDQSYGERPHRGAIGGSPPPRRRSSADHKAAGLRSPSRQKLPPSPHPHPPPHNPSHLTNPYLPT